MDVADDRLLVDNEISESKQTFVQRFFIIVYYELRNVLAGIWKVNLLSYDVSRPALNTLILDLDVEIRFE